MTDSAVQRTPLHDPALGSPSDDAESAAIPSSAEDERAQRTFSTSILISAVRCTLTYVIFPFVAPLLGLSSRVGPTAGVIIGAVAIAANLFSIRRFQRADHKWKWHMTALNLAVIGLLVVLFYQDLVDLLS